MKASTVIDSVKIFKCSWHTLAITSFKEALLPPFFKIIHEVKVWHVYQPCVFVENTIYVLFILDPLFELLFIFSSITHTPDEIHCRINRFRL